MLRLRVIMSAFVLAIPRGASRVGLDRPAAVLSEVFGPAHASTATPASHSGHQPEAHLLGHAVQCTVRTFGSAGMWRSDGGDVIVSCGAPELAVTSGDGLRTSDSVTPAEIAAAWRARGDAMLNDLVGRYALAIWDARRAQLVLQVDPLNMESLFLRVTDEALYASTEVTPLLALPGEGVFDMSALTDIISVRFLAGARTCWDGIRQVSSGHRCVVTLDGTVRDVASPIVRYGTPDSRWTLERATSHLESVLRRNLERLRDEGASDVIVPLSGGVDSSVLAALAKRIFPRCTAITCRVDDFANPELERSQEVARRLGMPLHVSQVSAADVARLHPSIIARVQEPPLHYNNPSVLRMLEDARDIAPIVLSGDVAGMYSLSPRTNDRLRRQATRLRQLGRVPVTVRRVVAGWLRATTIPRLGRAASLMDQTMAELVQQSGCQSLRPEAAATLPPHARSARPSAELSARIFDAEQSIENSAQLWIERLVEGSILRRNSRFSGPLGLRYHYPFADVAAMDMVTSLPLNLRLDPTTRRNKPTLRALCDKYVGADVTAWSKLGLPSPEREWMEGPLRAQLAESVADDSLLADFVDVRALRKLSVPRNQSTFWTLMTLHEVLRQGRRIANGPA